MFAISIRAYTISSLISLRRSVVQAARSTLSAATALLRRTNLSALVPLESQRTAFTFKRKPSICGCPASTPSNCARLLSVWLAAVWATILTRTLSTWTSAAFGSGVSTVLRISSPAINQDTGNPWQELFRAQRRARRCRRKNERFHPQLRQQCHTESAPESDWPDSPADLAFHSSTRGRDPCPNPDSPAGPIRPDRPAF